MVGAVYGARLDFGSGRLCGLVWLGGFLCGVVFVLVGWVFVFW